MTPEPDRRPGWTDPHADSAGAAAGAWEGPALILLVDDDPDEALLLQMARDAAGADCAVMHARDGAQGIALAEALAPDLILVDLSMPGMDGFEALAGLKAALPDLPADRLCAFSTSTAEADRERAHAAGAGLYISKPREMGEYLQLMARWAELSPVKRSRAGS